MNILGGRLIIFESKDDVCIKHRFGFHAGKITKEDLVQLLDLVSSVNFVVATDKRCKECITNAYHYMKLIKSSTKHNCCMDSAGLLPFTF